MTKPTKKATMEAYNAKREKERAEEGRLGRGGKAALQGPALQAEGDGPGHVSEPRVWVAFASEQPNAWGCLGEYRERMLPDELRLVDALLSGRQEIRRLEMEDGDGSRRLFVLKTPNALICMDEASEMTKEHWDVLTERARRVGKG